MNRYLMIGREAAGLVLPYGRSLVAARRERAAFDDVDTFCLFVGYPRSGHTLVAALLDAHPNVAIAQELDVVKHVVAGFSRLQIYHLIRERSGGVYATEMQRTGYSYPVPNQWQGRYETLRVVGDKKAGGTATRLRGRLWILDRIRKRFGVRLRIIHVVRNPYDNISTMLLRARQNGLKKTHDELIEIYFQMCESVAKVAEHVGSDELFTVRHEEFVASPQPCLAELCDFVGIPTTESYLADCASIVFERPNLTRHKVEWSPERLDRVRERLAAYEHLRGYDFER